MSGSVLLTFTGFHDPYTEGPVEGSRQPGPILSLLAEREFRRIVLFSTPDTFEVTEKTRAAIRKLNPAIEVVSYHLDLRPRLPGGPFRCGLAPGCRPPGGAGPLRDLRGDGRRRRRSRVCQGPYPRRDGGPLRLGRFPGQSTAAFGTAWLGLNWWAAPLSEVPLGSTLGYYTPPLQGSGDSQLR